MKNIATVECFAGKIRTNNSQRATFVCKKDVVKRMKALIGENNRLPDATWAALRAEIKRQCEQQKARASNSRTLYWPVEWRLEHYQEAKRQQSTKARYDMAKKVRRAIQKTLRTNGFRLEYTKGGSNYYTKFEDTGRHTVRVSDHDVPLTPERAYNANNGGFSWADAEYLNPYHYFSEEQAIIATKALLDT